MRFNHDAINYNDAVGYILNRATQLLKYNVKLIDIKPINFEPYQDKDNVDATFEYNGEIYHSVYMLPYYRGKGLYAKYIKSNGYKILTHTDCLINSYLRKNSIDFVCLGSFETTEEYKLISDFYGDKKANRSGVYLMNHIDEGIKILNDIGASEWAKRAYAIHPIFQSDDALSELNLDFINFRTISSLSIINVMEYRSVANEYLSKREILSIDEIRLSPLKDVNDMLIADKVQNYKDFELYHKQTHERSKELDEYFNNWLKRLNIPIERYQKWKEELLIKRPTV
jgi:hypothetical protein